MEFCAAKPVFQRSRGTSIILPSVILHRSLLRVAGQPEASLREVQVTFCQIIRLIRDQTCSSWASSISSKC